MNLMENNEFREAMLKYNFALKRLETELDILIEEYKFNIETLSKYLKLDIDKIELLKNGEDIHYITKIKKDLPFEKQEISRTALILLNYINRNYWLDEEVEKQKIKNAYRLEEEKYQKLLREKYNPDEIFKKRGNK